MRLYNAVYLLRDRKKVSVYLKGDMIIERITGTELEARLESDLCKYSRLEIDKIECYWRTHGTDTVFYHTKLYLR